MSLNIPTFLFRDNVLHIPSLISQHYINLLNELRLYEDAKIHEKKIIGGKSDEATLKFFSRRFLNSCARTEYLIVNPFQKLTKYSTQIIGTLCYGDVAMQALSSLLVELNKKISLKSIYKDNLKKQIFDSILTLANYGVLENDIELKFNIQDNIQFLILAFFTIILL